jgi:hypothetical protein
MLINYNEIFLRYKKLISVLAIIFILFGIIMFGVQNYFLKQQETLLEKEVATKNGNAKIVSFLNLFIDKVLQAKTDISFEDRLKLENAVRDLNDKEILSLWETFTQATTADEVQMYCKNLLQVLAKKIVF